MDKFIVIAALLLLTHLANAQPAKKDQPLIIDTVARVWPVPAVLKTGEQSLRYELIKPSVDVYKITTIGPDGRMLMEFTCRRTVSVDNANGRLTLTQDNYLPDGRRLLDSTIADLKTLAPIRMRMVTTPHFMSMNLDFRARDVHAIADKSGKKTDTIHAMEEGYFDSNLLEYVMGILPYRKGFKTTINTYTFERNGMDPVTVEFVGEDALAGPGGSLTWCYLARTGSASNTPDATLWVEKTTGKVLKRVVPIGRAYYVITKI